MKKRIEVSAKFANMIQAFSAAGHILGMFHYVPRVSVNVDMRAIIAIRTDNHKLEREVSTIEARLGQLGGTDIKILNLDK